MIDLAKLIDSRDVVEEDNPPPRPRRRNGRVHVPPATCVRCAVKPAMPMSTVCPDCTDGAIAGRELARAEAKRKSEESTAAAPKNGEFRYYEESDETDTTTLVGIRMSDIRTEKLDWLWPDKIPAGNVTLFGGQPGCGKTIVLLDIVATVTTGRNWPDGAKNTSGPKDVILLASEDGEADTIKPRLIAAGADMKRIIVIRRVLLENKEKTARRKHAFQLKGDISTLKNALKANPGVALVALDPISAFFGDCEPNKDKEIRPVMEGIADAMEGTKCAFVGIIHNNKRSDADSISKILGASSVVGVSRAVWGFGYDADDKTLRHMLLIKGNLSEKRTGMKYRLANTAVTLDGGEDDHQPAVDWQGETSDDADDMLAKKRDRKGGADTLLAQAKLLCQMQLESGPKLAQDMYRLGEKELGDNSGKTLKRASIEIGAMCTRAKPYYWYLPGKGELPGARSQDTSILPDTEVL